MNNENTLINVTEQVENAFKEAVTITPTPQAPVGKWSDPDAYRAETGKRFRMTKEERIQHGETEAGRLAAFIARQIAGLL
jgi:hypothetical protein